MKQNLRKHKRVWKHLILLFSCANDSAVALILELETVQKKYNNLTQQMLQETATFKAQVCGWAISMSKDTREC